MSEARAARGDGEPDGARSDAAGSDTANANGPGANGPGANGADANGPGANGADQPLGLRPSRPASPRWHRWRDLHNEGTRLITAGRPRRARARLREAEAETRVPDVDAEGLLHRAATLANLAGLAENTGRLPEAERLIGEAIALCRALAGPPAGATGRAPRGPGGPDLSAGGGENGRRAVAAPVNDDPDVLGTLANALVSRAQTRMLAGRPDLAGGDLDEAFAVAGGLAEPPDLLVFSLHGARAGQLMMTGELAEAEQEALIQLDIALAVHPELAAYPCDNLARIALACDNPEAAEEFRGIAADPHAASADLSAGTTGAAPSAPGAPPDQAAAADPPALDGLGPAGVTLVSWPLHPRWRRPAALNAEGARLARAGQPAEADAVLAVAERATRTVGGGLDALVCRANVLLNRAGVAEASGDVDGGLALADAAIEALVEVVAEVGDRHGMAAHLVDARNLRAALLRESGRPAEALAELALAEAALATVGEGRRTAEVWLWLVRTTVLSALGRLAEADEMGRAALALAQDHAPWLAPRVHLVLADLAGTLGDEATSRERIALAGELFAVLGDARGEAATLISLGRGDYLAGRPEEAVARYDRAEALLVEDGHATLLAACRHGRAAVAVALGRIDEGLALLDRTWEELGPGATPVQRIAFHQVRAGALDAAGRFAAADAEVVAARRLAEEIHGWHLALTMDWWRADSHARWAASLAPEERAPVLARALEVAVPAALAAEAARQFFTAGGDRERWVALAAAPSLRAAMVALRNAGERELAVAMLDHLTATASLRAEPAIGGRAVAGPAANGAAVGGTARGASPPPDPAEVPRPTEVPLPRAKPLTGDGLSYAAAALGLATGGDPAFPAPRLALPPRVRVVPGTPSPLEPWIERAERVYGFAVRASEAVRAW